LWQELAAGHPEEPDFRDGLAQTHNELGRLMRETNRPAEARKQYEKALEIQEKLAADFDRDQYRDWLAGNLNDLRNFLAASEPKVAERRFRQALDHCDQLVARNPDHSEYRKKQAAACLNLGNVQFRLGQMNDAETTLRRAVTLQSRLANDFPSFLEYRRDLAK